MTISKSDYYENPGQLPLLAVRDVVVYPYMQIALFVGREQSIKAIELAQEAHDGELIVVSQKDSLAEEININDLYQFGTRCRLSAPCRMILMTNA